MRTSDGGRISRKQFLQALGLLAGAGAVACGGGFGGPPGLAAPDVFTVYKFSTRGRHACRACANHARNKLFATPEAAYARRAHDGCNCLVRTLRVGKEQFDEWFPIGTTVRDLRG